MLMQSIYGVLISAYHACASPSVSECAGACDNSVIAAITRDNSR